MTDFRWPNTAILTILGALDFEFLGIFDIFISEIFPNQNPEPQKLLKWQFSTF